MIVAGIILIVVGVAVLFQTYTRYQKPERPSRSGVLTRLGALMVGVFIVFVGLMMVLPADEAEPTPESQHLTPTHLATTLTKDLSAGGVL